MRRQRGLKTLIGLAAVVGLGVLPQGSEAKVTTEQSASILVFPKVIADGSRDTVIQITNTSNNMRHAHCFYTNGALTDPSRPAHPVLNPPLWTEIDFDIWVTKQQPTHWVVSTGRLNNPLDKPCSAAVTCASATTGTAAADCCDAGFDPSRVPPTPPDFTGELKCIEVDAGGIPVPGNALKGEATIVTLANGDVSKYNAVGLKGFDTNNMDNTLCLGGGVSGACPSGAEYEGCPATWLLDTAADGAVDTYLNQPIEPALTLVPCTQNYETQNPQPVTVQFTITNEYEQTLSASTTFTCWATYELDEISSAFTAAANGGTVLQTRMRSARGTSQGVIAVIEEARDNINVYSAQNAHATFQDQVSADIVTIPVEQVGP